MNPTTTPKSNGQKRDQPVNTRFSKAEKDELQRLKPADEKLAAFVRRMALQTARNSGDELLKKVAAFVVGALSPDIDPTHAAELLARHLSPTEAGG